MKILNWLSRVLEALCFILMCVMVVVTFAQVINRFVFSSSFFWAEECAILAMVWMAFLGSAIAMGRGGHTRIDFLINLLPDKLRALMNVVDYLVVAAFVMALGYFSLPIIKTTGRQLTTGMKIPRSILFCSVLAGSVLIALYCLVLAVKAVLELREKGGEV